MKKGCILFHNNFQFHDNQYGTKLLIILNNPDLTKNESYIIAKTTSNHLRGKSKFGCSEDSSTFMIPKNYDFFVYDTWVILYDLYELDAQSLLKDRFNGYCKVKGNLRPETIKYLMDCIRESRDVENKYKKLILKK